MRRLLIRRRGEQGQALVEFALVLPVFILLLVGLFDLGRAVYAFNTISNASREAVRVAIVDQDCTFIVNQAVQRAVSLGINASDVSVYVWDPSAANAGNFTDLSHRAPCGTAPGTAECPQSNTSAQILLGCVIEVTVRYQYTAATPIIGNLIGTIDMSSTTRQPIERTCDSNFLTPPATCRTS
ncbi:MAG: TadE/TadG family type IV pilus assembly protein [Micromonosporaceae bacterium]